MKMNMLVGSFLDMFHLHIMQVFITFSKGWVGMWGDSQNKTPNMGHECVILHKRSYVTLLNHSIGDVLCKLT